MDDPSIGDLLQDQAKAVQQNVKERVNDTVNAAGNVVFQYIFNKYPAISPLSSPYPIDRWMLILSISLVAIAFFLAMQSGVTAVIVAAVASIPIIAMSVLWKHSWLSKMAMGLCGASIVVGAVAPIFFAREQQQVRDHLTAELYENRRKALDRVETDQAKTEEEKRKLEAAEKARIEAEEAKRKQEEERRNKEFLEELKKKEEAEERKRAEEAKRQQALDEEKRKKEEELRKKQQAEIAAKERELKRQQDLLVAEEEYQKKKLAADDFDHAVTKLEGELRVAKDELLNQDAIVERENSPRPPAPSELARARELKAQWKKEVERLNEALIKARADAKKAAAEKAAAAKVLDNLNNQK
ncbi:MAG TPA: hypothetical protein VEJ63_03725 [Planctomycetota bacterium]|nr:hypothetical protein [Planctomycetota bacterium]